MICAHVESVYFKCLSRQSVYERSKGSREEYVVVESSAECGPSGFWLLGWLGKDVMCEGGAQVGRQVWSVQYQGELLRFGAQLRHRLGPSKS